MTLRSRLVVAVAAFTLATLGAAFVVVSQAVNRAQERQLDAALLLVADREAREAGSLGGDELAISDQPGPAANDVGPLPKYALIRSADGRVLDATANLSGRAATLARAGVRGGGPFDLWVHGEHLRAVWVPIPTHPGVHLLVAASRADLDGDAVFLARAMVLVFFVAVVWSVLVESWVVRRFTRDHQAIAAVARRVAAGDLAARVASRSGDREAAQLARDVDDMIARLETLVTSQRRFIAHAAHELRSPLTTLLGELSLARRRSRDTAAYEAAIDAALDDVRRLTQLAEDLLALARLGAERGSATTIVVLAEVLARAVESVRGPARDRGVAIHVRGETGSLVGHAPDLERMLRNLLDNALRHAPRGTTVEVVGALSATRVELRVIDRGPGVPAEERERIFEPFYRAPHDRAGSGAGLGLAIVREVARAHDGDAWLDPAAVPAGACFVVLLPRVTAAAERAPSPR